MNYYSQAGQDRLVEELIIKHEPELKGTFLDVGCSGEKWSNTLGLEQIGWTGLLIDSNSNVLDNCPRTSPFIVADATTHPFVAGCYDYISLDVDSASLAALQNLLKCGVTFRLMTAEHDHYAYKEGESGIRNDMRRLLHKAGYHLFCRDVCSQGLPYEDWWCSDGIRPRVEQLRKRGRDWSEIIFQ